MVALALEKVEEEIIKTVEQVSKVLKMDAVISSESCPGNIGISSQILVTAMSRIARALDVIIPDSCYIFHDKKTNRQLSVKEASKKLIKEAIYGHK